MRRLLALIVLTACLLLAPATAAFADAEVEIGDAGLNPTRVTVDVREPIVWTNATDADVSLAGENPAWESGPIAPGATFSIEITQAGTYSYGSDDGSLTGQIVVGEGEAADEEATEEADPITEVDDEDERMPETGIDATVPGALSVMLIVFGSGLLYVTPKRRSEEHTSELQSQSNLVCRLLL